MMQNYRFPGRYVSAYQFIQRLVVIVPAWILVVLWTVVSDAQQSAPANDNSLEVIYLANEGFLIRTSEHAVVIDAFLEEEYIGYGAVPPEQLRALVDAQSPFESIHIALTTHVHRDHFQTEPALEFLNANTDSMLISSEQVIVAMRQADVSSDVGNQLTAVWPEPGKWAVVEHKGIKVSVMRLAHVGARHAGVQNLGFLIEIGDHRVLHVGDAAFTAENFDDFDLPDQAIDCAILPVWCFQRSNRLDDLIGAEHYIAAHILLAQLDEIQKRFATSNPEVFVPTEPMQRWTMPETSRR